jgi:TPR repeat protein
VVKDVEMEKSALKETFAKTEEPLGWYFAGRLSNGREVVDFYKKSAEGGCSWGQAVYGWYFKQGDFVEKDEKVYVEWLEKAANQNNPWRGRLGQ